MSLIKLQMPVDVKFYVLHFYEVSFLINGIKICLLTTNVKPVPIPIRIAPTLVSVLAKFTCPIHTTPNSLSRLQLKKNILNLPIIGNDKS